MDRITGPRVIIRKYMESDNYRSKGAFLPLDYIERIELDAQRYRKLQAFLERNDLCDMPWPTTFDAAVDALPEPE